MTAAAVTMKKKKKKPLFHLTYKEIVLWSTLFLFMSACMFALGVFIGRNTGPALFTFEDPPDQADHLEIATIENPPGDGDVGALELFGWLSEKGEVISAFIGESRKKIAPEDAHPGIKKNRMPKGLALHIAAFKHRKNAYHMIEELRKKRYPAYLSMESGSRHSVRVGNFKTINETQKTLNRLDKDNIKAVIVRR